MKCPHCLVVIHLESSHRVPLDGEYIYSEASGEYIHRDGRHGRYIHRDGRSYILSNIIGNWISAQSNANNGEGEWYSDGEGEWYIFHSICPSCSRLIIVAFCLVPDQPEGLSLAKEILLYPKSTKRNPPPQVPEEFTKDYLEAALIINDSPKASAALSRRVIQHILREKAGADQRNLVDAIKHVINEGGTPSYISDSLHTLREIGNFAAHPTKNSNTADIVEVEPGEASWCLEVIDELYDHYFVKPDKARQAKEAVNAKRKEAGRRPIP